MLTWLLVGAQNEHSGMQFLVDVYQLVDHEQLDTLRQTVFQVFLKPGTEQS